MAARIAEHRSIKYISSSDHNNCAMRAWHSMSRYGARYPLVAAYCTCSMLHVLALTISHVLARCNGARWRRADLCVFFSSCPRPIGKNSYKSIKCLMKTCSRATGSRLLLLFTRHVTPQCGPRVRRRGAHDRRARGPTRIPARGRPGTDPWSVVTDRATVAAGTPDL
jgi:hypothetical protein